MDYGVAAGCGPPHACCRLRSAQPDVWSRGDQRDIGDGVDRYREEVVAEQDLLGYGGARGLESPEMVEIECAIQVLLL